jgi:DNA polymerase (family 10)
MSANRELARLFEEMAIALELTGANPFRVNAHTRVARVLGDLKTDVAEMADAAKLTALEGIGAGTAKKILEYLETGCVAEHDELLQQIPPGLLEVLGVQGLGPKTVKMLWEKAGVTDLVSLQMKLDNGEIERLPRMGAKTVQNIKAALAFAAEAGGRIRLGEALPVAEYILERLRAAPGTIRVEVAGSVRRGAETVGNINVVAATQDSAALWAALDDISFEPPIPVDLREVEAGAFDSALFTFTGSAAHLAALRGKGLPEEIPDGDEAAIYAHVGLPLIPPELREDRGELALTETPRLVERADVTSELHAHTVASDGWMSIDELAETARDRGFHTVAVTDHSRSSAQANGLSVQRLREHVAAVRAVDARMDGIRIIAGSEVDILADGRLDYDDDVLAELDIVVASPHSALRQDPAAATARLLAAIRHPRVHIVGHPTGRIINRRPGLSPDMDALIAAAAEHRTALEINANPYRLDLRDAHVRAAVEAGALISINTDAHGPEHFDYLTYGVGTGRRGWLAPAACVNTWSAGALHEWLQSKR